MYLIFLTHSTYLKPQKQIIFGLQPCPINQKNLKRVLNHCFYDTGGHDL